MSGVEKGVKVTINSMSAGMCRPSRLIQVKELALLTLNRLSGYSIVFNVS